MRFKIFAYKARTRESLDFSKNKLFRNISISNLRLLHIQLMLPYFFFFSYEGPNCEVDIDECQANPCLNNGVCYDYYGTYICNCPKGFEGQNCELNLNECLSGPCANGGECIDDVGSYRCECPSGFTGHHCELRSLCENAACPLNSICVEDIHGPQCVCNPGFMGIPPNCTVNYCASNPCVNGGTCSSDRDGFNCSCLPEWRGKMKNIRLIGLCITDFYFNTDTFG